MKETEALWILFQGDFSDRARCNFISRRRRKCRAAGKTRNRKKFDRSIGRSVGRSVGHERHALCRSSFPSWPRICHEEYAYTRKYEVWARDRANIWLRSKPPSEIPPALDFRKYIFIERAERTRTFPRICSKGEGTGRGGEYFPDSRLPTSRAILRNCLFLGRKQSRYLGCYNIDLLARRTPT